jgi:hypothetical protein
MKIIDVVPEKLFIKYFHSISTGLSPVVLNLMQKSREAAVEYLLQEERLYDYRVEFRLAVLVMTTQDWVSYEKKIASSFWINRVFVHISECHSLLLVEDFRTYVFDHLCSTREGTKELLLAYGRTPDIIRYLTNPPYESFKWPEK